jgi:hypothetical protein
VSAGSDQFGDLRKLIGEKSDAEIVGLYGDILGLLAGDLGVETDEDPMITAQKIKMKLKSTDV